MTRVYISSQSPILSLGENTGQFGGELDVRQVVVPDRIVQAQRLVALAPRVAGALVALDDDRRHAELPQPGAERDAALAAADDHDVRLRRRSRAPRPRAARSSSQVRRSGSAPCSTPFGRREPARLLVALELVERGQQRPRLAVAQPQVPAAAADLGLELDPGLVTPSASVGSSVVVPAARPACAERLRRACP